VLVGKSNRGNDHLSHALARPEDYWFHADGQPGSHVVLRVEGRKEPGPASLREAAAIAAWYSKARPSSKVRVIFTRAKFVRKPRRGAAGLALVSKEKSMLVRPGLPAGIEDDGAGFEE
jgi:predicted ribosome quality control (RQC) complex YloA/Tae2 family protein